MSKKPGAVQDEDAFRLPSLERAAEQALSEICEIRVEGDLVGVVDVPIELRLYR